MFTSKPEHSASTVKTYPEPFSSLMNLIPCFIFLLISCLISIQSEGLRLTLVPPHSPESPVYLGNQISNQTSPYGESKILVTPVIGQDLTHADGYVFAAKIGIGQFGNPPQYKTYYLALDTGSTLTSLQCEKCQTGTNTCFPQVDPIFQNSLSTSYEPIMENHPMCISTPPNPDPNKVCSYYLKYADGANTRGEMAYEIFTFEMTSTTRLLDIVFGCGNDQKGFFVKQGELEKAAGILGLGRGKEAFPMQLDVDQGGVCFSYCFQDLLNQGGDLQPPTYLHFDECILDNPTPFQETPFQIVPNDDLYCVRLISIKIGDVPVNMPPIDKVIIDTGTLSLIITPSYESLERTLLSWLNGHKNPPRILQANLDQNAFCFFKEPNQGYEILPTIHFMLDGGGEFEIAPEQGFAVWKDVQQDEDYFCLMILPHDTLTIIGAYQQVNHKLFYDINQNKLLFKNEDCATTAKLGN